MVDMGDDREIADQRQVGHFSLEPVLLEKAVILSEAKDLIAINADLVIGVMRSFASRRMTIERSRQHPS
jgi:hypothetical protein